MKSHEGQPHSGPSTERSPYPRLAIMAGFSFLAMYALMYAMVDAFANVYNNLNQVYMAGLMAAPMVFIELALMRSMYPRKALNGVWVAVSLVVMLVCWCGIRKQAGISDQQFLRSMIPHHAADRSGPETPVPRNHRFPAVRDRPDEIQTALMGLRHSGD